MNYRIIKKPKGYIVEEQVVKWSLFGLKYKWIPYVKTSGLDECWHFKTYESALNSCIEEIRIEIKYKTRFNVPLF